MRYPRHANRLFIYQGNFLQEIVVVRGNRSSVGGFDVESAHPMAVSKRKHRIGNHLTGPFVVEKGRHIVDEPRRKRVFFSSLS